MDRKIGHSESSRSFGGTTRVWVCVALALCVGVIVVVSGGVGVGQSGSLASAEPPRKISEEDRVKVLEKLHVVRSIKLAEALELDEETQRTLEDHLKSYDKKMFEAEQAFRGSMRRLKKALRKGGSDDALNALSDEVLERRRVLNNLRIERMTAAGKNLTGQQRARLLIFMPNFEKRVRKSLRKMTRGKVNGEGPERRGKDGERREKRKRRGR